MSRSAPPVSIATFSTMTFGVCVALTVCVASPSKAQAAASGAQGVAFTCPAGQILTVEFAAFNPQAPAVVHPPNGPSITLPSLPRGDGFRYGDADHELRGKGNWVTWTEGSKPPVTCTASSGQ